MTLFHNKMWIMWGVIAGVFIGIIGSSTMSAANESDSAGWVSKIVSIQGTVRVRRHGQTRWQPVKLNDTFFAGDQIHVEVNSRAGILLSNDSLMRLDQNSFLIFTEIEQKRTFIFKLLEGAANFFSHRPRSLKILTPFVNGVIEGTEFFVQVDSRQTRIELFEGRILARNDQGMLELTKGDGAVAQAGKAPQRYILVRPRDSVQWAIYYPPVLAMEAGMLSADVNQSLALFNDGQTTDALVRLESISPGNRDANFYTCRAAMRLHVGRIAHAQSDIEHALAMNAQNSDALALKAVIAVVQNRAAEAVDMARQAVQHRPRSASAHIALSYALQAQFKLSEALDAAQEAVVQAPGSGLAWARLADLQLSVGALDKGVRAARKAAELAPRTAHAHTILGFAHLTRIDTRKARESFNEAIGLDSAAPLPRLGLGLAVIRDGNLELGRSEIEIAAGLDPGNSLIRSYLGKAYFDEKRDPQDGQQFEIAKTLDPNDPTPWFYDAIRKQTVNRPVEALQDLQKSIELNDNRAIYRSRLQLDEDLASRGTSLARIYDDLGFEQLGLIEASRSLDLDPGNHSAHRFLSDIYARLPRHEIARVSELLQAQLLQPINMNPVQPSLSITDLNVVAGGGPAEASFNEFTSMFERNRMQLTGSGLFGSNKSIGEEIVLSGLYNFMSFSLGQFHFETDGFRENNDYKHDIYDVFAQAAISPSLNIQAEFRHRKTDQGDLDLNFIMEDFSSEERRTVEQDTVRFGGRLSLHPRSHFIFSLAHNDFDGKQGPTSSTSTDYGFALTTETRQEVEEQGYQVEARYLMTLPHFDLTVGGGYYSTDSDGIASFELTPPIAQIPDDKTEFTRKHQNVYAYTKPTFGSRVTTTLGIAYDSLEEDALDMDDWSPKVGLEWNLMDNLRVRAAAFKTIKRALIVDQTIEPTQVSGFNQLFDDPNGTEARRYGIGLDVHLTKTLYIGGEVSRRDLEVPVQNDDVIFQDEQEDLYRAYLYWTPFSSLAFSSDFYMEKFKLEEEGDVNEPIKVDTVSVPISLNYFGPLGFFGKFSPIFIYQSVERSAGSSMEDGNESFILVNATIGFRLPKRRGIVSLEAQNLFDKKFRFQDDNFRKPEPTSPEFIPDRVIIGRVTFTF